MDKCDKTGFPACFFFEKNSKNLKKILDISLIIPYTKISGDIVVNK